MSVRRKSNWYIYLIAFGIAFAFALTAIFTFRWYLFPEDTAPVGLNAAGELDDNFKPTEKHNFNSLVMISDDAVDSPKLFILIEYNAVDSRLSFVPLPDGISVQKDGRTMSNIYAAQGGKGVIDAVNNVVDIEIVSYAKIDRAGFVQFVNNFGNVRYDVPKTIIIQDTNTAETINAGNQLLDGDSIFRLIMVADYEEGESYRFNCIGNLLSELVNQNFRNVDSSLMDTYFNELCDLCESDLSEEKYQTYKPALLNSIEYGVNPAEYYIPYGEYTQDGGFVISENSITSIRQKAGK